MGVAASDIMPTGIGGGGRTEREGGKRARMEEGEATEGEGDTRAQRRVNELSGVSGQKMQKRGVDEECRVRPGNEQGEKRAASGEGWARARGWE